MSPCKAKAASVLARSYFVSFYSKLWNHFTLPLGEKGRGVEEIQARAISSSLRTWRALTNMVKDQIPWPEGEELFYSEKLPTSAWQETAPLHWQESLVSGSMSKDAGETGAEVYFLSCTKSMRIVTCKKNRPSWLCSPFTLIPSINKKKVSQRQISVVSGAVWLAICH